MTPPTMITILNQSTRLTDSDVAAMTHSCGAQLARDVAPVWGTVPALEFAPANATPTLGTSPCTISDTPDAPGAAGYHDEGTDGVPFIKVFTFDGAPALLGSNAESVTLSHELCEVVGDSPANKWADGPDGSDVAFELCDPVESDTYEIDGVSVSNFVYPAWFDPKAAPGSKFDFMGTLSAPFTMTAGGYMIKRTEPGNISNVFAAHGAVGHHCVEAVPGIIVIFGVNYPEHKKAEKVAKAARRRG